ncbi:MAG: hypothetical protein WCE75_00275 [Terracidiphilus sp.]
MNQMRGVILILLAGVAFWEGFTHHAGQRAWLAYGLGAAALLIGIWRLTGKPPRPLA